MMRGRNIDGWLGPDSPATRQLLAYYDWMQHTNFTTLCRYSLVAQETIRWYHEMVEGENWMKLGNFTVESLDQSMLKVYTAISFRSSMLIVNLSVYVGRTFEDVLQLPLPLGECDRQLGRAV